MSSSPAYSPTDLSLIDESQLLLPSLSLWPFVPCFIGFFALVLYLAGLLLQRCWVRQRIKFKCSKEDLLEKELKLALLGVKGDEGDKELTTPDVSVGVSQDGDFSGETLHMEVFKAQEFSSKLHDISRKLASILASERGIISFLIPRWTWNTRKYIMSLISEKKASNDESSTDGSLVCVPISILHIRKKIQASSLDPTCKGKSKFAKVYKEAGFEGAQLAIFCKAVQIMQENLETRWKMCISIIRFTVANLLTIYAFWYTHTNSIEYLAAYIAGEFISGVYTQPLIQWLIPKLDQETENVVLMLKLHLEDEAAREDPLQAIGEESKEEQFPPVTGWVKSYFTKFDEVRVLLSIRDRDIRRRSSSKRAFRHRTMNTVASVFNY